MIRDEEYDEFYAGERFVVSGNTLSNLLEEAEEMGGNIQDEKENVSLNSSDIEIYTYEVK